MPLAPLLLERFKIRTRAVVNPKAITAASTTAQMILANNPNRLGWVICNLDAVINCFIGFENDVSSTKGVLLGPGDAASMVWDEDFEPTSWAQWIIAASGTPAVYSHEVVEA